MKNYLKASIIVLTLASVMVSCKKDDDTAPTGTNNNNNNNPPVENPEFSLQLNFQKKEGRNFKAVMKDGTITINAEIGSITSPQTLLFYVNAATTGTYVTKEATDHKIVYAGIYSTQRPEGDGKITISAIDTQNKTLSGTFNAIVFEEGKTVKTYLTEGKMVKIPYTEE